MQNVSEIRHHIAAVGQTRKITNAMQMVSSARMRKFRFVSQYIPFHFKCRIALDRSVDSKHLCASHWS